MHVRLRFLRFFMLVYFVGQTIKCKTLRPDQDLVHCDRRCSCLSDLVLWFVGVVRVLPETAVHRMPVPKCTDLNTKTTPLNLNCFPGK